MFAIFLHPLLLLHILGIFLWWYILEVPWGIVRGYWSYVRAISEIFSFSFLCRTLLSIWKGIGDEYPKKGFHLDKILATFCMNCISRVIGAVVRFMTLILGLLVHVFCLALFLLRLALWAAYPVGLFFGVAYILQAI